MSYIDIGIIAFLVLFAALGVWKGVQKSALALGAFVISFIIAFFLANVVAEAFLNIDSVRQFVMGKEGWSLYTWINSSMGGAPWEGKSFIAENFFKPIYNVVVTSKELSATFTAHDGVALCMAFGIFSSMIGLGLFIVIRALMCIVTMIVKSYIPRKKSVGNRVAGLFVGMGRGAIWAFIITIVFSAFGGLAFLPAVDVINDNYDDSVMAKYLNEGAYGIKNGVFIPDEDMFNRLVIKGGFNVHKPEEGEDPPASDALEIERNELYADIMNLNYASGSK
ncbi:MAG: CvpA family protein, partial [Clostridiales bacterium]|nr:CvpA family protein [Clostridiales bacterium]